MTPTLTEWSAWPKEGTTFADAWVALTNIVFAYSFAVCQFSFMDEMHTPTDYVKSIRALGIIEIVIYTLTGALIYAFVSYRGQVLPRSCRQVRRCPRSLSASPCPSSSSRARSTPPSSHATSMAAFSRNSVIRYINIRWAGSPGSLSLR